MTADEWLRIASDEAKLQAQMRVEDFKENVKCCFNCDHWNKNKGLIYNYLVNTCECHPDRLTGFDCFCKTDYEGPGTQENLLTYLEYIWDKEEE